MATIPTDLLRSETNNAAGILSALLAKARLLFVTNTDQQTTLAERVNQADAEYYDRFYG